MKEYCAQVITHKTEPKKHEGYNIVKKAVTADKFLKAKHHFWISLAQDFQPFLQVYQCERPMIPFLASDLEKLLRAVMARFVKRDVMQFATGYLKLVKVTNIIYFIIIDLWYIS